MGRASRKLASPVPSSNCRSMSRRTTRKRTESVMTFVEAYLANISFIT